ncbi:MAG: DUF2723 domain-containing protein [Melioribacteraceae bacterium]|nr:DUF2723 domain-containing protein [Melioribacteraceae bacterium]
MSKLSDILTKYWLYLSAIFVFIIYLLTLAPSVVEIDSGELAAVQITLGIAHPTGYPVYTIAGFLFSLLPFPLREITQMNLLAALYCTVSFYFFTKSLFMVLSDLHETKVIIERRIKHNGNIFSNKLTPAISALTGGFSLAFSKSFWLQSTSAEVYSLHVMLISILIYLIIKNNLFENASFDRGWYLIALLYALAFGNHMTTLLLVPSTILILFLQKEKGKTFIRILPKIAVIFLGTIIIVYSYLYLRALTEPQLNWGDPSNLQNILRHVAGKQYQVWMFTSFVNAKSQLTNYFLNLPGEFGYPLLFISLIGIIQLYKFSKNLFWFFLTSFIFTVIYSSNYDIKDIEPYYLLANISIAFFISFGFANLYTLLLKQLKSRHLCIAATVILLAVHISYNYNKADRSGVYIFEDYTKSLINSTENQSLILSYQWDYFISASYYFQLVEDFRNDVAVVDKELLRRSWYYKQLENIYPGIFDGYEDDVKSFLEAVKPFEGGQNFDPAKLENFYQKIMTSMVYHNSNKKTVYLAPELVDNEMRNGTFKLPSGFSIVPELFLFKVVNHSRYIPLKDNDLQIRIPEQQDKYHKFIVNIISKMAVYRILYELEFNKVEQARLLAGKIISSVPGFRLPAELKKRLLL